MNAKKSKSMGDAAAAETKLPETETELPIADTEAVKTETAAAEQGSDAEQQEAQRESDDPSLATAEEQAADAPGKTAGVDVTANGPVPLLGKTQDDAAATAHAAGTVAETQKPAEPAVPVARIFDFPPDFRPLDHGYTVAQVLEAAIEVHQENKAYCESIGDMSQVDWEQAPDWQCQSVIQGVCHAIATGFGSPEENHINWMKHKVAAGWQWGVEKNPDATPPTHPCIMPYANLPEEQRKKNTNFLETVRRVLGPRAEAVKEAEPVEKGPPTEEAKAMASMLECAAAMSGLWEGEFEGLNWPEVAMCLADYFRGEPYAPAAGGLMQLKLKLKVILLPGEDPRRVELILDLFRLAVTRMEQFIAEDAKAEADRQLAQQPQKLPKPAEDDATFARDDERFDKSDIGKALDQRAQ